MEISKSQLGTLPRVLTNSYSQLVPLNPLKCNTINTAVERPTEAVVEAANIAIPRTKETNYLKSKYTLWWNEQCAQAVNDIKHASNISNKHKATENLVNIKIFRAVARKTL